MHLALVIGTTYDQQAALAPLQHGSVNTVFMADFLGQRLGGFELEIREATGDLPEYLEDLFASLDDHLESLLVYFSGYAALREGKAPAMLLNEDPPQAFPLSRLLHLMSHATPAALAVIDATLMPDTMAPPERCVGQILETVPHGVSVTALVGVDAAHRAPRFGPSRFTDLFLVALESLLNQGGAPITASAVSETMKSERAAHSLIGATAFRQGATDFPLGRREAQEDSGLRQQSALPSFVPSLPPPPAAGASGPLPSFREEEEETPPPSRSDSARRPMPKTRRVEPPPPVEKPARAAPPAPASTPSPNSRPELGPSPSGRSPEAAEAPKRLTEEPRPVSVSAPPPRAVEKPPAEPARPVAPPPPSGRTSTDPSLRERLERARTEVRATPSSKAIAELVRLAEDAATDPAGRASLLTEAAAAAADRLNDPAQGIRLAFQALEADATSRQAFDLAERELSKRKDWQALAALYGMALPAEKDPARAVHLAERLGHVYGVELRDEARAVAAFKRLLEFAPGHARAHAYLGEMFAKRNLVHDAVTHYRAAAAGSPRLGKIYTDLFRLFERLRAPDAMWQAASAMVALNVATPPARAWYEAHRIDGLPAPRQEISNAMWAQNLLSAQVDPELNEFMMALARPAAAVRLQVQRKKGPPSELNGAEEHEPQKSTATLARTLLWTSRLVGVAVPRLYLNDDPRAMMQRVRMEEPASVVSRTLGKGLELSELAFLWGRHLPYFRPEFRLVRFFPNPTDLENLVIAANALLAGPASVKALDKNGRRLAGALDKAMTRQELDVLRQKAVNLRSDELSRRIHAWAAAAELTASRIGLVCSGDLTIAVRLTQNFPLGGVVPSDAMAGDLHAYAVSAEYGTLRQHLGLALVETALAAG